MKKMFAILFLTSFVLVGTGTGWAFIIDGVLDAEESSYYRHTNVSPWGGGMSIDVYGAIKGDYLYMAVVADQSSPGWPLAVTQDLEVRISIAASPPFSMWPAEGLTSISPTGGVGHTGLRDSGRRDFLWYGPTVSGDVGWSWFGWGNLEDDMSALGIEMHYSPASNDPGAGNFVEALIPLPLITYAGSAHLIGINGVFWQDDWSMMYNKPHWFAASVKTIHDFPAYIKFFELEADVENSLLLIIYDAIEALNEGDNIATANLLCDFIDEVEAYNDYEIIEVLAISFIDAAQMLMEEIMPGNNCEIVDSDNDGIPDDEDSCPEIANPEQEDNDSDGIGDVCDPDDDNDGISDEVDECPFEDATGQDANDDGCIDKIDAFQEFIEDVDWPKKQHS